MKLAFSLENINEVAAQFLNLTAKKKVFAFHGQMGAGKTTFINALCGQMGVKETMSSPTYSIINQYSTKEGGIIYHIDLYRLKDEEEAINAGVEDAIYSGNLCFVEWPEIAPDLFPVETLNINISTTESNSREISFSL